ncbi:2-vinyl bacteriochlorophyllide hydratase [Acidisoma sp. 7E03]
MITSFSDLLNTFDSSPWSATSGRSCCGQQNQVTSLVYTPDQRRRRDDTPWTRVQGILAPLQFLAFLVSTGLVLRYLVVGHGYEAATISVVIKTLFLYAIMITGSLWEKAVFGRYLMAPAFFWEDMFSFLVIGLHTAYLLALATGALTGREMMLLALTAFAAYLVNAVQFLLKFRAVRREAPVHGLAAVK